VAGFDTATAVTQAGPGAYDVVLDPDWSIGGKLNGGYLLAVMGRAVLDELGPTYPHPVAATAHYLSAPEAGPARVEVTVLRSGRRTAQVRTTLHSGGQACIDAVLTCGTLDGAAWWDGVTPVDLPPEQDCQRLTVQGPGFEVPLMGVLSERLDRATLGWATGSPSMAGELRGWLRFEDQREPDPLSLLLVVDALPPATFDLGLTGWVPTLELTCHVRAVPAPGPLMVRQRARGVSGGRVDEECDVWDSTGRLVASGHQLALVAVPSARPAPPSPTGARAPRGE
jgi:hypothetical protein